MAGGARRVIAASAAIFLGVVVAKSSFARQADGRHHAQHSSPKAAAKGQGQTPQVSKIPEQNSTDAMDTGVPLPSRPFLTPKSGETRPPLKQTKPEHLAPQTSGPPKPVVRNAIGQPVTTHEGPASGEQHGRSVPAPSPSFRPDINRDTVGQAIRRTDAGEPTTEVVRGQTSSKAGSTTMMRPVSPPSGLGGPAKPAIGVSGSAMSKPTH